MGVEYRSSIGEVFPCYNCHLDPILEFDLFVGDGLSAAASVLVWDLGRILSAQP
jgi:hypothetical protein